MVINFFPNNFAKKAGNIPSGCGRFTTTVSLFLTSIHDLITQSTDKNPLLIFRMGFARITLIFLISPILSSKERLESCLMQSTQTSWSFAGPSEIRETHNVSQEI